MPGPWQNETPTPPSPPAASPPADETDQVLALLDEYSAKLASALDARDTDRQWGWAAAAAAVAVVVVSLVAPKVSRDTSGTIHIDVWPIAFALWAVAAGLIAYAYGSFARSARARDVLAKIAARLDPVIDFAVGMHDRGEQDDVRDQLINLRLTEAVLRVEQVENLVGDLKKLPTSPRLTPKGPTAATTP